MVIFQPIGVGQNSRVEPGLEVIGEVATADEALDACAALHPDVVLADTVMPGRTGYDICQYLKMSPRHRFVRVILTAGVIEAFDEAQAERMGADGTLRKPFEASVLIDAVRPLAEAAKQDRAAMQPAA